MTERTQIVFAGGGTGGHLFPALAVVESLRSREPDIDIRFFCTEKPLDRDILTAAKVPAVPLGVQPFPSSPWRWPSFWLHWQQSVKLCIRRFQQCPPGVVVGAGGYASGPPVHAALRLGIPTFLLNPDAVPGRANRYLAERKGLAGIFAQWQVTRRHFPPSARVMVTGCPVRPSFFSVPSTALSPCRWGEILESFGLASNRRTLLVTGASQGAHTINQAVSRLAGAITSAGWPLTRDATTSQQDAERPSRVKGWQILHLSGAADVQPVAAAYRAAGTAAVVLPFTERMADALAVADLIISRAGASTLAELLALGKPSILLPYPFHRDRHQWHNGAVLVQAGAAAMLEDRREASANARQLGPLLSELMADEGKRQAMAAAAQALGRPEAADLIADVLLSEVRYVPDAFSRDPLAAAEPPGRAGKGSAFHPQKHAPAQAVKLS